MIKLDLRVIEYWDGAVAAAQKRGLNLAAALVGLQSTLVALLIFIVSRWHGLALVVITSMFALGVAAPYTLVLMRGLDYRTNIRRAQELNSFVLMARESWARRACAICYASFVPIDALSRDLLWVAFDLLALALFYTACATFIPGSARRESAPAGVPERAR